MSHCTRNILKNRLKSIMPVEIASTHRPGHRERRSRQMIDTNTISPVLERPDSATTESYAPVCIAEVELAEILPTLSTVNGQTGQHYQSIHCVVRLHSQPLGIVKLDCGDGMVVEPHQYAPSIWNALH